jgi:hypothetical protein
MEHFAKQIITQKNHKKGIIGQNYLICLENCEFYCLCPMVHAPLSNPKRISPNYATVGQ